MELQEGGPQAAGRCVVRGYSSSLDLAFLVVSSGWSLLDQTADVSEIINPLNSRVKLLSFKTDRPPH